MASKNGLLTLILKISIQILNFLLSKVSSTTKKEPTIHYSDDHGENVDMKQKLTGEIKKKLKCVSAFALVLALSGCLSFNMTPSDGEKKDGDGSVETVLLANSNNVYRLSADTILKVRVQRQKDGKWVDSELRVLIPENWFIVSGDGIQ